jgi:O-antigen/teichoic acid export membrane protein
MIRAISFLKYRFDKINNLSQIYVKQVGYSFIIKLLNVFISFLYVPIVLNYLNAEKFGIWIALTTIINWIKLFDVGIGNGLRNKLALALAKNDLVTARELVSTTYFLLALIFFVMLLIIHLFNPYINWNSLLNTESIVESELFVITSFVITFIIVGFVLHIVTVIFTAHGNSSMNGVIQFINSSVSLFIVWIITVFLPPGNLLLLSVTVTGIPILVYFLVSIYVYTSKYKYLMPSFSFVKLKGSRSLLVLSSKFFITQISATILYSSIPFIVTRFYGPTEVAQFHIASSIFNLPIIIIGLITSPVIPLITHAYAKGDLTWIKKMLTIFNFFSVGMILLTLLILFFSDQIYKLWVGDKVEIDLSLSVFVSIYACISLVKNPYSVLLNGLGKINILTVIGPTSVFLFIILCYVLNYYIGELYAISLALSIASFFGLIFIPKNVYRKLRYVGK